MRAYARDIGILPSRMSEIMSGKKGFSIMRATEIAACLKLQGRDLEMFITSVAAKHSRSSSAKKTALEKFEKLVRQDGFSHFDLEKFKIVSDWHHIGILNMVRLKEFSSRTEWIAQRLGISNHEAEDAIQRLIQHGLLFKDETGKLRETNASLATPSEIPSEEIRKFHKQVMKKAEQSLEVHPVEERDFSSVTMAIQKDKLAEAKEMIREFRRKFCQAVESPTDDADRIYSINIQFIPMDNSQRG